MTNNESMNQLNAIRDAADAFALINRITNCDCTESLPRTRTCFHFDASCALRDLLIDRDANSMPTPTLPLDFEPAQFHYDYIRSLLRIIDAAPYQTDAMTALLLDNSLCPMHCIDYAICFDDDDDECATIRLIHPSHDT